MSLLLKRLYGGGLTKGLPYGTSFGELKLEAVWGPAVSARFEGASTIGAATTGARYRLKSLRKPVRSILSSNRWFIAAKAIRPSWI
jgi:hypothetical protein